MEEKHIKIGELEIPKDYWTMQEDDRYELCLTIIDGMLTLIDKHVAADVDRMIVLDQLLNSSIESNEQNENYEVCQMLLDLKKIINESPD